MTWLKTGLEFSLECSDLSDAAFRTHVEALGWVMYREKGPKITYRDVERFAESPDRYDAVKELVEKGFWREISDGYEVRHYIEHQPTPKEIREQRAQAKLRAKRYREAKKAEAKKADEAAQDGGGGNHGDG